MKVTKIFTTANLVVDFDARTITRKPGRLLIYDYRELQRLRVEDDEARKWDLPYEVRRHPSIRTSEFDRYTVETTEEICLRDGWTEVIR